MSNSFRSASFIFLFLAVIQAMGQKSTRYWEPGFFLGTLNSSSDISVENDVGNLLAETRPRAGVYFKYNFNPIFALGTEASYGAVYAADRNHGFDRGYVMQTSIAELNVFGTLNFKKFGKFFRHRQNTPYVKFGLGAAFYNPKLDINQFYPPEYDLYPNAYQAISYTFGFGWKWRIGYHWMYSMELAYTALNQDNLEGFINKGSSMNNDGIFGLRLAFSYGIFE